MANGNFGGGDGSELNPYLVEDAADLNAVRLDPFAHYKQVADLSLLDIPNWEPISYFYGVYDGDNYKIFDLKSEQNDCAAFCYRLSLSPDDVTFYPATLKNIDIVDARVKSDEGYAVILVAFSMGTIMDCRVSGDAKGLYACGVVASVAKGIVARCSAHVTIAGQFAAGFTIWGNTLPATITDCYVQGAVCDYKDIITNDDDYAHVAGFTQSGGEGCINCYSAVTIDCDRHYDGCTGDNYYEGCTNYNWSSYTTGLFGKDDKLNTSTNCYSDTDIAYMSHDWASNYSYKASLGDTMESVVKGSDNQLYYCYNDQMSVDFSNGPINGVFPPNYAAQPINGAKWSSHWAPLNNLSIARNTVQMQNKVTYVGWDFDEIWDIREGETYPFLRRPPRRIKCKRVPLTNFRR